ncbi:hypothetical protein C8Q77DRAFT_1076549 [Trametes polyzona]|nr:hypothetical protein C8Q77DRAFT_1076549 [Trametes polyzona]
MAVTSQRIPTTIHGVFGGPSCFAPSMPLSINPAQASSFTRIPNVCAPRSRSSRASNPGPATGSRTAPASVSASSAAPSIMGPSSGSRSRRTSLSFSSAPTPSRRAPPPPPAPAERPASVPRTASAIAPIVEIPTIEDPFADALEETSAPPLALSPPPLSHRTQVSTYTIPVQPRRMETATGISAPPGLAPSASSVPSAKDIRGRLVASALLSRGSGRPLGVYLRRRLSGQEHVYVKSGLSQLVACAA